MAILVDWAKQTVSGTPGTGTITLSAAVTGFIKLQDDTRLVDGGLVYYSISDGSNYERGIGTYTASGTTLARTKIHAKYESGTYSENPGTGLTLTSAAIVSCSAVAATHNHRGALVYHSTTQSIATGTLADALFDTEVYDTDGFHSTVTNNNRFTIPANSGIVKIKLFGAIDFALSANYRRIITFQKNGASFSGGCNQVILAASAVQTRMTVSSPPIVCTAGDYFTIGAYQDSGGNLNINSSDTTGYTHWFAVEVVE